MKPKEYEYLIEAQIDFTKNLIQTLNPIDLVKPTREIHMQRKTWTDENEEQYISLIKLHQSMIEEFNSILSTIKGYEQKQGQENHHKTLPKLSIGKEL